MSRLPSVDGRAVELPGAATPGTDEPGAVERIAQLADPLQLISLALHSVAATKEQFPDYRLTRLISARLELDESDLAQLPKIFGEGVLRLARDVPWRSTTICGL